MCHIYIISICIYLSKIALSGEWEEIDSYLQLQKLKVGRNSIYAISSSSDVWRIPYEGTHNWTMVSDGMTKFKDIALDDDFIFGISNDNNLYKSSYHLEKFLLTWSSTTADINLLQILLKKNYIYGLGWDRNLYRHTYNMNNQNWDKVTGQDKNDDIFSFDVGENHIYAIRDGLK